MGDLLSSWLERYSADPGAFARTHTDPVLWIEPHREEAESDDERSLHTASGVNVSPLLALEPLILAVRKHKDNAFQRGVTLGRTPNNDLVVDDGSVSRFHAWFQQDAAGGWAVADAGSKNGSWVSVKKLEARKPVKLSGGEKLRFGSVEAWFLTPEKLLERLKRRAG